ncbi:MAG: riboflavin synthase [Caldimicrobium sp.]|nr:riboflavin synthase [Caldimicrobium sp.]MCX7613170.1 riboflavin synthase [Caldimicrobium sp.]MDW8182528.1 riboflavin synthase [Caldimicrobium sp.]
MFTGIIEGRGRIRTLQPQGQGMYVEIESEVPLTDTKVGDSIAVDGICLTANTVSPKGFSAHISPETLSRTTFKLKKPGEYVNLERALRLGDPIGGHLVSGHVDGIAKINKLSLVGYYYLLEIDLPREFSYYLVPKGSIAIDGISLTINEVVDCLIKLMIIPHTYKVTTLSLKREGDLVNFEIDLIAKMVYRLVKPYLREESKESSSITIEFLRNHGFA